MAAKNPFSSLNRRLRNICEREGMDYGEDATDEADLERRFRVAIQLTSKNIGRIMSDIKAARTVDLCFLIDGTSSMRPHIEGVRDSVSKIVNTLMRSKESPAGVEKVRLAVVVYRDFDNPIPMEVFRFTEKPEACVAFCNSVRATSGKEHDPPEDVLGGLEQAARLNWSHEAGSRVIFHMGDAPCHGVQYHASSMRDNYPAGDPNGRTSSELFKQIKELGADYYFGKICGKTDQMIDKFSVEYGRFIKTFGIEDIANIAGSVIASVSATIETNVEQSKLGHGRRSKLREFQLVTAAPHWDDLPVLQGTYLVYDLPDSVEDIVEDKPLDEKQVTNVRVKVATQPFAEGSERIAYYGQDLFQGYGGGGATASRRGRSATRRDRRSTSVTAATVAEGAGSGPTDVVLKEYKHLGSKQNTLERYMTACEAQTIAFYLADKFNELSGLLGIPPIKFLKTKTLLLKSESGIRFMSCERKFLGDTRFVKFTNNCRYSMQTAVDEVSKSGIDPAIIDAVMTFSHWTYERTEKFLMVVDLQGCICPDKPKSNRSGDDGHQRQTLNSGGRQGVSNKLLMTDPALHCVDTTRYAPLNLGKKGMQAFFDGHRCGQLCRRLGLAEVTRV